MLYRLIVVRGIAALDYRPVTVFANSVGFRHIERFPPELGREVYNISIRENVHKLRAVRIDKLPKFVQPLGTPKVPLTNSGYKWFAYIELFCAGSQGRHFHSATNIYRKIIEHQHNTKQYQHLHFSFSFINAKAVTFNIAIKHIRIDTM